MQFREPLLSTIASAPNLVYCSEENAKTAILCTTNSALVFYTMYVYKAQQNLLKPKAGEIY